MKRYERAKKEGLNWQAVLVQDLETDIKIYMLNAVRQGVPFNVANQKAMERINATLKELDSEIVKSMAYSSLVKYASRVYVQAMAIYGNQDDGAELLLLFAKSGVSVPDKVQSSILSLPPKDALGSQISGAQGYNRAVANGINPTVYERKVIELTNQILDGVAKVDYSEYSSLRASVERQLREEWHAKELNDLRAKGVNLVWIDSHANCSERCREFQGRLYSLNGTSGEVDGVSFVPLSVATDVYVITKAGKTYKNGCLSGFNCRHRTIPYKVGFRPQTIPESVTRKQYAVDKRLRELEREVRKYEARALGYRGSNKKMYKASVHYRNKWMKVYEDFAKKNNVPIYPSRIDI